MVNSDLVKKIQKEFDINAIYARSIVARMGTNMGDGVIKNLIQQKPKPFVKWVGGKRQLLTQFKRLDLYPPEGFDPATHKYFEPFVGGGAVFFDLLPKHAELSDLNKELVITYNVIKNNVVELISALKKHKHEKEYFLSIRALDNSTLTDVEIASRFIYLNRTCFNGLYRVNSKGQFNVPFGLNKNPLICDEVNLRRVSEALQDVSIKHQDYKEALKKAKKGDFVYFDPPYHPLNETSSFTSYTKENFSAQDQIELRDTVLELHKRGCFVMLSNSDAKFINDIYSGHDGIRVSKVEAGRAINSKGDKRGKIKEVLVTNY